jgi:hypothetical protein
MTLSFDTNSRQNSAICPRLRLDRTFITSSHSPNHLRRLTDSHDAVLCKSESSRILSGLGCCGSLSWTHAPHPV